MLNFEKTHIEKHTFHALKKPMVINDVNIKHTQVSNKYLIGNTFFSIYFVM